MTLATAPAQVDAPRAVMIADPTADTISKLEKVLITGDLAALTPEQRVFYYREVCDSAGLNPLTKPFDYLNLNGKLVLYANKSCTDQVRRINGIEVTRLERDERNDLTIVIAYGRDRTGRGDSSIGAVNIKGLAGEALANALMKAETKAKRRLTLSLSGLGLLDEIEVDSAPGAWRQAVDMETGELLQSGPATGAVPEAPATLTERMAAKAAQAQPDEPQVLPPAAPVEVEPVAGDLAPSPAVATGLCGATPPGDSQLGLTQPCTQSKEDHKPRMHTSPEGSWPVRA